VKNVGVSCLLEVDLHTSVSYCVVIRSCVAILHCVDISSCVGSASCVDRSVSSAYSHTEKEMRGQRMRHEIVNREGRAFQVCFSTRG